ncbi:MAG: glutathione peroxidase [Flammeovirgaceae bacterium]|nr:glutathione peroxidase [Flammeovirgaceae bacterium]
MRYIIIVIMFGLFNCKDKISAQDVQGSIYDFKINSIDGELIDFEKYKGSYLLVVNTASKCGYTPQYADLQKLHEQMGAKVNVLGFPANNFLWQEPGSNEQIVEFCKENYGVSFQMFEKISVKGNDMHPLYKWLAAKTGEAPGWNFYKYLIDPEGNVVGFYSSKINPLDPQITSKIK